MSVFFRRTGLPLSPNFRGLPLSEIGGQNYFSMWGASLSEDFGLSKDIQEVILYQNQVDHLDGDKRLIAEILGMTGQYIPAENISDPLNLCSVFSEIRIRENNHPGKYFLPLQKLDIEFEMPKQENKVSNNYYQELWEEFIAELQSIEWRDNSENLYYLIKKYCIFMPSSIEDISLFDYIKVRTAVSTCIYKFRLDRSLESLSNIDKPFLFISGGLSGIQNFIYRIASPANAQAGMAKRLRGRSFYLNLLTDAVTTRILDTLQLPNANLLWCGGGNFLIIAPNTGSTIKKLNDLQKEINTNLVQKFDAELFLNFASDTAGLKDLADFSPTYSNLEKKIRENKKKKFVENLKDLFTPDGTIVPKTCPVCATPIITDDTLCESCKSHTNLGSKIARANYCIKTISNEKSDQFDGLLPGVQYKFLRKSELLSSISKISEVSNHIELLKINDTDYVDPKMIKACADSGLSVSFGFMFLANTVPKHKFDILSFSNIAELSKGADKLGILKMDVDNLGKIITKGLDEKQVNIARISTVSTMLNFYFSGILNKICQDFYFLAEEDICESCKKISRKITLSQDERSTTPVNVYRMENGNQLCNSCHEKKTPAIYVNYAGGDDLLIVGPWDDIVQLSTSIRENFKEFTCHNRDINISAGISVVNKKFPIGRAAFLADDALHKSKDKGKDSISLFGETVHWDTKEDIKGFNDLLDCSLEFEDLIENKEVSKSFVYSLLDMWNFNFGNSEKLNDKAIREKKAYIYHLKYQLARNVQNKQLREKLDKQVQKHFPWIRIPVSWVSLRTR